MTGGGVYTGPGGSSTATAGGVADTGIAGAGAGLAPFSPLTPSTPGPVSGGAAYNTSVARQYRSDSLTQQRLGQLIQMAEEEEDASAELLRRSLYQQSFRTSISSFVACKKVSYIVLLFSDIKDHKQ